MYARSNGPEPAHQLARIAEHGVAGTADEVGHPELDGLAARAAHCLT